MRQLTKFGKGEKFYKFENIMKSFKMFKSLTNLESPKIHLRSNEISVNPLKSIKILKNSLK